MQIVGTSYSNYDAILSSSIYNIYLFIVPIKLLELKLDISINESFFALNTKSIFIKNALINCFRCQQILDTKLAGGDNKYVVGKYCNISPIFLCLIGNQHF